MSSKRGRILLLLITVMIITSFGLYISMEASAYESELKKIETEYNSNRLEIENQIKDNETDANKLINEISASKSELNNPIYNDPSKRIKKNFNEQMVKYNESLLHQANSNIQTGQKLLEKLKTQYHNDIENLNKKYSKSKSSLETTLTNLENSLSHLKNKLKQLSINLNTLRTSIHGLSKPS